MGKATDGLLKLFGGRRRGFVVTDAAGNPRVVPFTTSTDVVHGDGSVSAAPTTGITQLTGDVTAGPGTGSQVATLAASGVTAGTYGDSTHVVQFTVDAKGRVTAASNVAISASGHLHGLMRVLGDGVTTTFNLLDLAEYLEHVAVNGSIVDPLARSLSADRSQITFDAAPGVGQVVAIAYVIARL